MKDNFDKDTNVPGKPLDKPLREWTLGDVRKVCVGRKCGDCPFYSYGEPKCMVHTSPYGWNLEYVPQVPLLTEPELAIMRAVGATWVSRDDDSVIVRLWDKKPEKCNGKYETPFSCVGTLDPRLFPSVHPGDCIAVENI